MEGKNDNSHHRKLVGSLGVGTKRGHFASGKSNETAAANL